MVLGFRVYESWSWGPEGVLQASYERSCTAASQAHRSNAGDMTMALEVRTGAEYMKACDTKAGCPSLEGAG